MGVSCLYIVHLGSLEPAGTFLWEGSGLLYVLYVHNFKQCGLTPWSEFLWETQRMTSVQRNTSSFEQFNFGLLVKEWGVRLRGQWVNTTFVWRMCQIKNEKSCDKLMLYYITLCIFIHVYLVSFFKITGFFMCSLLDKGRHFIINVMMIKYDVSHHCKKRGSLKVLLVYMYI